MICQSAGTLKGTETSAPSELSLFTAIAMAVLSVTTTSGNLSVVITIIRDPLKKLHTPFNYFLLNLALSDLLLGLVTLPLGVVLHVKEYVGHDLDTFKPSIKALHMSLFISGTASLLSLIALSIDRFVAVTYSTKYKTIFTFHRCVAICLSIWMFSLSFPFLYFAWDYIGYMMFFAHSAIFVALLIMVVTQILTKKYLRDHTKQMVENVADSAPATSAQALAERERKFQHKMARLYLMILSFFVGTYIPAVIMIYILHFCETCDCTFLHVLRDLSFLLISANSCVNPFIYAIRVGSFRASIKSAFCYNCCFWNN